jgi:hypothetical protein
MGEIVTITLTSSEMMIAAICGVMRQITNLRDGRRDAYGCQKDGAWQIHIEGACGEMAVARYLGVYYNGNIGNLRASDAGRVQVRTRSRDNYDLIVHPEDNDNVPFVLVTGTAPTYILRGWLLGIDAKQKEYWIDPAGGRPAYFVPQHYLNPMDELLPCLRCL